MGYSPWGLKESDMTERLDTAQPPIILLKTGSWFLGLLHLLPAHQAHVVGLFLWCTDFKSHDFW